jgi:hypothetical protein
MSQKTYEVSFNNFFGSTRTCIMKTGDPEVLYEFVAMTQHQAIIQIKEWIREQKELQDEEDAKKALETPLIITDNPPAETTPNE